MKRKDFLHKGVMSGALLGTSLITSAFNTDGTKKEGYTTRKIEDKDLAYDDEEMRGATSDHPDWGASWRQNDLDLVRSSRFRDFLREQRFVLVGWKDLVGHQQNVKRP